jgi:transcriptional regulator with XRE-family HTH domain
MVKISEQKVRMFMALVGIESQKALAERAGVGQTTLVALLHGSRSFTGDTLDRIATALECNPLDLLVTDGHPAPHMGAPAFAAATG